MLYLVHAPTTVEGANRLEESGKFPEIVDYLLDRFNPEAFYVSALRREGIYIVDFPSLQDVWEFSYIVTQANGMEPTFTPLIPGSEIPDVLDRVEDAPRP